MSPIGRWKWRRGLLALAIIPAGILLAAPAADARVGVGINLGFPPVIAPPPVIVAPPPVVVAPPVVAAPPVLAAPPAAAPPVVVAPPVYYAAPPAYYYAPPAAGFFWYDRFGHRHWRR